jgi:hypothetical protein
MTTFFVTDDAETKLEIHHCKALDGKVFWQNLLVFGNILGDESRGRIDPSRHL